MKPWQLQQADRAWRRAKTAEKISLEGTQGLNAKKDSVFLLEPKCFLLTFLFIGPANVCPFSRIWISEAFGDACPLSHFPRVPNRPWDLYPEPCCTPRENPMNGEPKARGKARYAVRAEEASYGT